MNSGKQYNNKPMLGEQVNVPTYGRPTFPQHTCDVTDDQVDEDDTFPLEHSLYGDDNVEEVIPVPSDIKEIVLEAYSDFHIVWYGEESDEQEATWSNMIINEPIRLKTTKFKSPDELASSARGSPPMMNSHSTRSDVSSPSSSVDNNSDTPGFYYQPWNKPVIGEAASSSHSSAQTNKPHTASPASDNSPSQYNTESHIISNGALNKPISQKRTMRRIHTNLLTTQQSYGFIPLSECQGKPSPDRSYYEQTKLGESSLKAQGCTELESPGYVLGQLAVSGDNSHGHLDMCYRCKMCDFSSADKQRADVHMRSHAGIFRCPEEGCTSTYQYKCNLVDHTHKCHSSNPQGQEVGYTIFQQSFPEDSSDVCDAILPDCVLKCGCDFMDKPNDDHLSNCPSAFFTCLLCDERFKQKKHLKYHLKKHDRTRYRCTMCDYVSVHRSAMLGHLRTHSDERNFKCSLCDLAFRYKSNLKEHIRIHTGEKPYSCNHCDRTFHQSGQLKMHMVTHTGEKPYKCDLCPQAFKRKDGLRAHRRVHTGETLKCDECDFTTRIDRRLSEHKRWHTGNIYKCQKCSFTSIHKCNMRKHMQSHENNPTLRFKEYYKPSV